MKDLWSDFGVRPGVTVEELDRSYVLRRSKAKGKHKDLRLAWKILRDPYAAAAYGNYKQIRSVIEAGFFDDEVEPENYKPERNDLNWLTTPFQKIINNIHDLDSDTIDHFQKIPPVVLLSTGAFSPIHQGHLMMMENAKKELENRGRTVLGGYISPSHDKYVFGKYKDVLFLDTSHRLRLCEKAVAHSDWLMSDPWEARYNDVPITYTDVITRLEAYLAKHLHVNFPVVVFYVFGGDNAPFARLFAKKGGCVCIKRPSHEDRLVSISHDPLITGNNNILIVDAFYDQPNISSTEIRNGTKEGLASIDALLKEWQHQYPKASENKQKYIYAIRNDSRYATKIWTRKNSEIDLTLASLEFLDKLSRNLEFAFSNCSSPDIPILVEPILIDLNDQQNYVTVLEHNKPIINLDTCTFSSQKLDFSRLFSLCDGQCRWERLVCRPGSESMSKQFAVIKPGKYDLIDDDIATGYTVNSIMEIAPKNIKIDKRVGLLQEYLDKHKDQINPKGDKELLDIVDFRDFLVGSLDSGLVVSMPTGEIIRAPYLLPYVSLVSRGMIPPSVELSVSMQIWKLNITFHNYLKSEILLEDSDPSFIKLMKYIGFDDKTRMVDICRWHLNRLQKLAFK
ncbi:hypothetical protein A3K29_02280 [Candidatus Collierbacteria bacterium RIFOXYB2_FULL_46_14]|uniref:NH(3)-dependent NAD(+) synthetase n=1 Tax=Candidatus Collierbacteria bacterium GW2011_GWA2_46_26 TaxID=1618381 RepID=A0A0G1PIH5_9BACT|nr:MAG: NH(3)-dependent NAD(+) synthetase [Candidatus Collierbacteria bacterium GW2011_GWC2_44_13]KKU32522.1 MAG: NH(3)-dependent NAD(+) synthetase [Candidatus Collierbacteria bacterium GW2011_GWA2_46_26]OGD72951.1 MAG: hypothetical protein A3K29_02280 [Candidatus Collierbacteria bacterium RIFOXYB2_FULL_46_14]OGD75993.1 MAG: hypothetical protein A3K43_02280 [Candidatus Collierbacteria bacterium RIFOXYA2_FULL_46_20]OGD77329.1 MAG: hypothetical protein A3K39_02280 [Candidatus Collierbacteria bact